MTIGTGSLNSILGAVASADCRHSFGKDPTICIPMTHAPQPSSPDASLHMSGTSGCLSQKCVDAGILSLRIAFSHHCSCRFKSPRTTTFWTPLLLSRPSAENSASLLGRPGINTCAIQDKIPQINSSCLNDTEPLSITSCTRAFEYCVCSGVTYMLQSLVWTCAPRNLMPSSGEQGPCVLSLRRSCQNRRRNLQRPLTLCP